jgi:hypothetical protein
MKCKWGEESHSRQTEEKKMHHHLDRRVRLPSSKAKLLVCEAKQNMEMTKRNETRKRKIQKIAFGFLVQNKI